MDKVAETPLNKPFQSENRLSGNRTLPQTLQSDQKSRNCMRKTNSPEPLKVPKEFIKYPERYTSPTDKMISPISKGLLARNRKARVLLPPTKIPPKLMDPCFQNGSLF